MSRAALMVSLADKLELHNGNFVQCVKATTKDPCDAVVQETNMIIDFHNEAEYTDSENAHKDSMSEISNTDTEINKQFTSLKNVHEVDLFQESDADAEANVFNKMITNTENQKEIADFIQEMQSGNFDDTIADKTWTPEDEVHSSDSHESCVENKTKKRTRKHSCKPETWNKNVSKKKRNSGEQFQNTAGNLVLKKSLKTPCNDKCRLKCTNNITNDQRQLILEKFWKLGNITHQRQFIAHNINEIKPKYNYKVENTKRGLNSAYYVNVNNNRLKVCKKMFMSTLAIGDHLIRSAMRKTADGITEEDKRGKHDSHKRLDPEIIDSICKHIESFPRIESHYLRSQTSREYIDGSLSIAGMHRLYQEFCKDMSVPSANIHAYSKVFNEQYNIGFYTPKKDQCSQCEIFKLASATDRELLREKYEHHIQSKIRCREEKEKDKASAINGDCITACFDLQAVINTPEGNVSIFYYKRKLSVYNLTVFNLGNSEGHCYVWDEAIGKRGANEIGSAVLDFLKNHCTGKNVVFYSDNCRGQNKNKFIASIYMYAVLDDALNIPSITHKFFTVGHGQNEGDSMHSVIEKQKQRALKSSPIYVPAQWVGVIQSLKKTGKPYTVKQMSTESFYDLKNLSTQVRSNFNIGDEGNKVTWNDIKILQANLPES